MAGAGFKDEAETLRPVKLLWSVLDFPKDGEQRVERVSWLAMRKRVQKVGGVWRGADPSPKI